MGYYANPPRSKKTLLKQQIKYMLSQTLGMLINMAIPFEEPLILNYHGICLNEENPRDINDVRYKDFTVQIKLLQALGYKFLSLTEFSEAYKESRLTPAACMITFDDVPRSFIKAAEYLSRDNIPFVVFVCVAHANSDNGNWCRWDDLRKVASFSKAEFGSHSVYHRRLSKVNLEDASKEIEESFHIIFGELDNFVRAFAFPYGAFSLNLLEELNKIDVFPIFLTDTLLRHKTLKKYGAFRRIPIGLYDSEKIFLSKIKGRERFL